MNAIRTLLKKAKKTFLNEYFIKFCILGIFNTVVHGVLSKIFSLVLQPNAAFALGFFGSNVIAFLLNSYVIFNKPASLKRYIRFLIAYIPYFTIGFLVTFITINTLKLPQFTATVLAAVAGGPITFVIMRVYAFGRK
mgnify:CR=1 FL=1